VRGRRGALVALIALGLALVGFVTKRRTLTAGTDHLLVHRVVRAAGHCGVDRDPLATRR
jgi:hypothetical protein